jgi:hypothetical protein
MSTQSIEEIAEGRPLPNAASFMSYQELDDIGTTLGASPVHESSG